MPPRVEVSAFMFWVIQAIAPDVLRHRIVLSYEAEAEGIDSERVVSELVARVPVP